jgi:hypothetical protein
MLKIVQDILTAVLILFVVLIALVPPAIVVRIIISNNIFPIFWPHVYFRRAVDTFLLMFALLFLETTFMPRQGEGETIQVGNHLLTHTWNWQAAKPVWSLQDQLHDLLAIKHFVDYFPIVVLFPSLAVGLAVCSLERSRLNS